MTDINAIRKLADAATRGPWEADAETVRVTGEVRYICDVFGLADKWPTAEFIAASRTLVPALCDEVEQLRAELAQANAHLAVVRALCDQYRDQPPPIFQGPGLSEHGEGYNAGTRDMARAVLGAMSTAEQVAR